MSAYLWSQLFGRVEKGGGTFKLVHHLGKQVSAPGVKGMKELSRQIQRSHLPITWVSKCWCLKLMSSAEFQAAQNLGGYRSCTYNYGAQIY